MLFSENFNELFIDDEDLIVDFSKFASENILKSNQRDNVFYINFHRSKSNIDELRDFLFFKIIKNDPINNNNSDSNGISNEKTIFKNKKKLLADFFNSLEDQSEENNYNKHNKNIKKIERSEELVKKMLNGVKTLIKQKKDILDYKTNYFSVYPIFMSLKEKEALKKRMNLEDLNMMHEEKQYHSLKAEYEKKLSNDNHLFGNAYKDFKSFLELSMKSNDLYFNVSLLSKKLQNLIKNKITDPIKIEKEKYPVNYNEDNGTGMLNKKKQNERLDRKLTLNSLSIEYFWREAMLHYENFIKKNEKNPSFDKNNQNNKLNNTKKENEFNIFFLCYRYLIENGEPFEILDGDNNYIYKEFILKALEAKLSKRIFKILMLGQQNTGKSTLLNILFGTVFKASDGRCTKGIYGSFISSDNDAYDYRLILDTEGLDSFEKADKEYDDIFSLFTLSMTDAMIINVKDQLTSNFEKIISNAAKNIKELKMHNKTPLKMFLVFNQKQDHKNSRIQYASVMDTLVKKFRNENIQDIISLDVNNSLYVLPLAFATENIRMKTNFKASADKLISKANEQFINWNIYSNLEDFFIESN